jgi:hypothetical protein
VSYFCDPLKRFLVYFSTGSIILHNVFPVFWMNFLRLYFWSKISSDFNQIKVGRRILIHVTKLFSSATEIFSASSPHCNWLPSLLHTSLARWLAAPVVGEIGSSPFDLGWLVTGPPILFDGNGAVPAQSWSSGRSFEGFPVEACPAVLRPGRPAGRGGFPEDRGELFQPRPSWSSTPVGLELASNTDLWVTLRDYRNHPQAHFKWPAHAIVRKRNNCCLKPLWFEGLYVSTKGNQYT